MAKPKPPTDRPFILRVASFTNFNHTPEEAKEVLDILTDEYPNALPFVNTCSGDRLMVADWPIIITGNPYLDEFIAPSKKDPGFKKIAAVRLKYVHGPVPHVKAAFEEGLRWCNKNGIPALITMMRFSRISMMYRYVVDPEKTYGDGGQFRARSTRAFTRAMALEMPEKPLDAKKKKGRVLKAMEKGVRFFVPFVPPWSQFKRLIRKELYFVCDGKLRGCPWCQNCNWLTYRKRSFEGVNKGSYMPTWVPFQVNLRASRPRGGRISPRGNTHCHHDCPECFAREKLQQAGGIPSREIAQNEKQKGATSHPFLREFKVSKARKKEVDGLLEERAADWPTMRPETPGYKPGIASSMFAFLPSLLPTPDTDTQWVDHAIDALDKYDEMWAPTPAKSEEWLRGRQKEWSEARKREQSKIRDANNKMLNEYAVLITKNLEERFTAAFDKRTKKMGLDPVQMAEMIRDETELLRTLVAQLKAGDFGTVDDYINHLRVTATLLEAPETVERLTKGISKRDREIIEAAVKAGTLDREAADILLGKRVAKVSKAKLKRLAEGHRAFAAKVEKDVLKKKKAKKGASGGI